MKKLEFSQNGIPLDDSIVSIGVAWMRNSAVFWSAWLVAACRARFAAISLSFAAAIEGAPCRFWGIDAIARIIAKRNRS